MNSTPQSRIQTASRILAPLCVLAFVFIPAVVTAVWIFGSEGFLRSGEPTHYFIPYGFEYSGELTPLSRLLGMSISLLPNCLLMFGIWNLRKLFIHFGHLEFFTVETTRRMKNFALSIFIYAFAYPIAGGLLSVGLSALNPATPTVLTLTAGHQQLMALFVGGVFLLIAWLMGEGQRLSDEIEQFV